MSESESYAKAEFFRKPNLSEYLPNVPKCGLNIMTFKALRGDTPRYLSDLFVPSHNDMYQLRSNDRKLYTEKPKTNFLKKSFSYRGAVSWNSLPSEIVDVQDQLSLSSFKTLINHYYKDLEKNTSTI